MKIGVVGLGLIGGSIFKALEALNYDVIGISDSQNGLQENISNDFNNLKDCEMVFVATPMNKTLDVLQKLEEYLPESSLFPILGTYFFSSRSLCTLCTVFSEIRSVFPNATFDTVVGLTPASAAISLIPTLVVLL